MAVPKAETLGERADAIFEQRIKPLVAGEDPNAFLAIDILSGNFEVAQNDITPGDKLRARHQDARIFLRRVGDEAAYTTGGGHQDWPPEK